MERQQENKANNPPAKMHTCLLCCSFLLHGCCYLLLKELYQASFSGRAKQHTIGKRLLCRSFILPHQQKQKQQQQESVCCRTGQQPQQADCPCRHSITYRNNKKLIAAAAPHNSNNKLSATPPPPATTSRLSQHHHQQQAVCH
jgi:hypothetical protein